MIHFGGSALNGGAAGSTLRGAERTHGELASLYCRWLNGHGLRVFALMPEPLEAGGYRPVPDLGGAIPLWYTEQGLSSWPTLARNERIWIVNGAVMPTVQLPLIEKESRRHRADVAVFGFSASEETGHYPESVLVNEHGEVVRFQRHYHDSPDYRELWVDDAALVVASARCAAEVTSHLVLRGWDLASIGALSRNYTVRWCKNAMARSRFTSATLDATPSPSVASPGDGSSQPPGPSILVSISRAPSGNGRWPTNTAHKSSGNGSNGAIGNRHNRHNRLDRAQHDELVSLSARIASSLEKRSRNGNSRTSPCLIPTNGKGSAVAKANDYVAAPGSCYRFAKRTADFAVSAAALIALSPVFALVALLIKCTSRGPVFFAHRRQGVNGREFPCLKFRSMRIGADAMQAELRAINEVDGPQFKLSNDPRLTKLGNFLRRTNIDELPQIINVLLGQMSLVGPRPSPDNENQLCPAWRRSRLSVRPGITGLWQVLRLRDQDQSDFQEWIYYDVEYVRHQSFWLDVQIIFNTPISMFAGSRLRQFARRLARRGICAHSARLQRERIPAIAQGAEPLGPLVSSETKP